MAVPGAPTLLPLVANLSGSTSDLTEPGFITAGLSAAGTNSPTAWDFQIATDSAFTNVVQTFGQAPSNVGITFAGLLPATTYYVRSRGWNSSSGYGAYSATVNLTTPAQTALDGVLGAEVNVSNGVTVSLRSSGVWPPTVQLGYSAVNDGTAWTGLLTIPTAAAGGASTSFLNPTQLNDLALVADPSGNLYVIGQAADVSGRLLVRQYTRVGASNAWSAAGVAGQSITAFGFNARWAGLTADFMAQDPTGATSPIDCLLVGVLGVGYTSTTTLVSLGINLIASSSSTPIVGQLAGVSNDVPESNVVYLSNSRLAVRGVVGYRCSNGVFTSTPSFTHTRTATPVNRERLIATDPNTYILAYVNSSGALVLEAVATSGFTIASASIPAASFFGGTARTAAWDLYYDRRTNTVRVYFIPASASNALSTVDITGGAAVGGAVSISTTFGAAGSSNKFIRISRGLPIDERHLLVESSNVTSGAVQSLGVFSDLQSEVAPSAPVLTSHADLDAANAATFAWAFADANPSDSQRTYQLQVINATTSAVTYDSGTVTSSAQSAVVPANSLVNGQSYKWQVRTGDQQSTLSAFSAQGTFNAAALGTITITDPAADDPAGIITSSYNVKWTYAQGNGYTQTQRRVRVLDAVSLAVYSDTTMQASTVGNYTVTNLPSGVRVRIEVSLVNSNGQTAPVAARYLTSTWASPPTATVVGSVNPNYNTLTVTNPASAGSQPNTDHNLITRRITGSGSSYTAIGVCPANSAYNDHTAASGVTYDYLVQAEAASGTLAPSAVVSITSATLVGVWVHNPLSPDATDTNFLYATGRSTSLVSMATVLPLVGRRLPIVNYGENDAVSLTVTIPLPWGSGHDSGKAYWVNATKARQTLCYRDGRGRVLFGALSEGIGLSDVREGTQIAVKLTEVDFTPVAS